MENQTFQIERNRIALYSSEVRLLAEITFPEQPDGTVSINHTFVDDSLRGQGIAGQLVQKTAELLRSDGRKACPTCSYAVKWFEKNPGYNDILL